MNLELKIVKFNSALDFKFYIACFFKQLSHKNFGHFNLFLGSFQNEFLIDNFSFC